MSHVAIAGKYVKDVLSGKIPANKWTRLACERHLKDIARSKGSWRYRFDKGLAEKVCSFLEVFPHTKGEWAGRNEPFILSPWQCFLVCSIFGWVDKSTGLRRFRIADLRVARKNGKSDLSARIGLYMLTEDGEYGAEVFTGATKEKQAFEVFRPARIMAERTPAFRDFYGVEVLKSNIHSLKTGSRFEPLIGKPGDGSSPSCAIVDEYHEHDTDDLVAAMITGMGARRHPLMLRVSTAGVNMAGPCYAEDKDGEKILEGTLVDDTRFVLSYGIDIGDDWADPSILVKANPNMDVSVSKEYLLQQLARAKNNSRKQGEYRTKHLNEWVGAKESYFDAKAWDKCKDDSLSLDQFEGERIILGIDLATKNDIAALEILIPRDDGSFVRFGKYYLPQSAVDAESNHHYRGWANDGWITVTDGNITDLDFIEDDIMELANKFTVVEIAFDAHQAMMLVVHLMKAGLPCVEVKPGVLTYSEPMKTIDALMRDGKIYHNGDPVMAWMVSNVVTKQNDYKGNVYPRKEKEGNKIDGVVALISAMNRAIALQISAVMEESGSIYDTERLVTA